jgi:hypothetical protein
MTDDGTTHLFDSAFRARNRVVANAAMILAAIAPLGLGLLLLMYVAPTGREWPGWLVTAGAFGAAGVLTWIAQDRLALLGNQRLRRHLSPRLDEAPEAVVGSLAYFVGFSPTDELLTWDGDTDLDVGFLGMGASELVFLGDRYDWSLQRERVDRIELTQAPVGPRRVLIYWHAPREAARALSLESREATGLRHADRQTRALYQVLAEWFENASEPSGEAARLGYPPTDHSGGRRTEELGHGSCAVTVSMATVVVLTVWDVASSMVRASQYCYAVLWSGFIFVGGAVLTRGILQYLQHTSPPRPPQSPEQPL